MTMQLWERSKIAILLAGAGVVLAGEFAVAQAAGGGSEVDSHTAQSTREMGERLAAIFRANDWKGDPNKPAERAVYYGKMLEERKLSPADQMQVLLQLAKEFLQAGESEKAINAIERLRQVQKDSATTPPTEFDMKVRGWRLSRICGWVNRRTARTCMGRSRACFRSKAPGFIRYHAVRRAR